MPKKTKTSSFGVSRREGHDSAEFYERKMLTGLRPEDAGPALEPSTSGESPPPAPLEAWADRLYCQSAESLPLPEASVGLAFTSPPYNVGKDYDLNLSLDEYLAFIGRVGREVYRVLKPGGRYVVNIANLGRKPYLPLHAHFYKVHGEIGFLAMGEIIWQKGKGASGNCAWGSWKSAKAPRLRDLHEYLLVFAKGAFSRPEQGESDIEAQEFMEATLSVWQIPAESARKVGHPAPFPLALAERVIRLYSYVGDVVLDPFAGSGTTCLAAKGLGRHYVGVEVEAGYCELARRRVGGL
jgi:site-specific DNA-methyltransferase (adenine-specific)